MQSLQAQTVIPLYKTVPNTVPNTVVEKSDSTSKRGKVSQVVNPTLTVFLPEKSKATGAAVIICPGGGYSYLVVYDEGANVARALAEQGVAAFVLKYRLPSDAIMANREIGPLQDAQQAFKLVRERASEFNIDPARVGIMGFSAGGHLASTASTHYKNVVIDNPNATNLRPDFSVLIYAVISFQDGITHKGSKKALIGETASAEKVNEYSNEMQITADTPPTFLMHASDDKVVPVENSINYYTALHKNGVKAEMHIYESGGHGFGMNNATTTDKWFDHLMNWIRARKLLETGK